MYLSASQPVMTPRIGIIQGGKVFYLDAPHHCNSACGMRGVCRLGVGSPVVQEAGSAIMQAAPLTGPAAPFVAAGGEIVKIVGEFFGGGCGSACIESAQAEQVAEVAGDNLQAVAQQQPGAISQANYQAAIEAITTQGLTLLQQLEAQGDKNAANGITNMQKSMAGNVAFAGSLPTVATAALNLSQAQAVFINPATKGWYAASVSAGNNLTNQILQSMTASAGTVGAVASFLGVPEWALLLGAGVAGYFLFFRGGN